MSPTVTISSEPFHALAADLKKNGFTDHGARLESVLDGVWTTSSELMGELGAVVIAIRKECRPLTADRKALIKECMRQVRKAWPGFGLLSFFPPWRLSPLFCGDDKTHGNPAMNARAWLKRVLHGAFLIGTTIAAALWIAAITAQCEGFGCLGVGAIVGMVFVVQIFSATVGGILIWLRWLDDQPPGWLIIFEVLHLLPVLWFVGRMVLG